MFDPLLENFHFLRPWFLLGFVPLAFIAWRVFSATEKAGLWESICEPELMPFITDANTAKKSRLRYLFLLVGVLAVLALAGPAFEKLPTPVFRQQSALVIVLDLSRSMNAEDIKPSRLERAKFKISDLLRMRKDGQTALVVFADQPFVVTPLTNDARTIENQLPALSSDVMPSQGSNINLAIKKAADLLEQASVRGGDILVLTDATDADPDTLEDLVSKRGLRISTIGVGTPEGAPVSNDRGGFISDESGNVILMTLDIVGLRELANIGNGLAQTISADSSDVERYVRFIDRTDNQNSETSTDLFADRWREFGPWLLLACIPFAPLAFRRGLLSMMVCANLGFVTPPATAEGWFSTPDQQGHRAFQNEQFDKAKSYFKNKDWRAAAAYRSGDFEAASQALENPASATQWYNKGNSLARLGQFEEAINAYQQAMELTEQQTAQSQTREDAAHNKSLLEKLLEQQNQQQNQGEGDDKEGENEEEQGGESQGESGESSDTTQQGGDSAAESDEMNPDQEQPEEEASKSAEEENEESEEEAQAEKQADEAQQEDQEGGKPNEQMAEMDPNAEPNSEQEQATEQWLRQIPDDPGGLLRRKFEYEYQKRGARGAANSGGQRW